jgi:ferredoxin
MPFGNHSASLPVKVNADQCIAGKGCTVCVDVCPLDVLRIE